MHDRPLIRQYMNNRPIKDTAASVTAFNSKLQENLKAIGADTTISFHFFRSMLANQASQVGAEILEVYHAIWHHSAGSHMKDYQVSEVARFLRPCFLRLPCCLRLHCCHRMLPSHSLHPTSM